MLQRPFSSAVLQSLRIVPCFFLAVVPLLLFFWRFALAAHLDSLLHARQQLRTDKGWGDPCAICVTQWSIYRCLRMMFHARVLDISHEAADSEAKNQSARCISIHDRTKNCRCVTTHTTYWVRMLQRACLNLHPAPGRSLQQKHPVASEGMSQPATKTSIHISCYDKRS